MKEWGYVMLLAVAAAGCLVDTDTVVGPPGPPGPQGRDGLQGLQGTPGEAGQASEDGIRPWVQGNGGIPYNGGSVGIGTDMPVTALDVRGRAVTFSDVSGRATIGYSGSEYPSIGYNVVYTDTSNAYKYRVQDTASLLRFGHGLASDAAAFELASAMYGDEGASIDFSTHVTILHNGNVGVGTAQPDAKLAVNGRIYSKDPVAFLVYSSDFPSARRLVIKWTGPDCASARQYKFWVDDASAPDTAWHVLLRDGTEIATNWYSAAPNFFGLGTSEATALKSNICGDFGFLYLDTSTETFTLSSCMTCVPLLWYQYNMVVPLVAGNFIKADNVNVQK